MTTTPQTMFEKVWRRHEVSGETADTPAVLYIDLHLIHEVTSPQAFSVLRGAWLARASSGSHPCDHGSLDADAYGTDLWRRADHDRLGCQAGFASSKSTARNSGSSCWAYATRSGASCISSAPSWESPSRVRPWSAATAIPAHTVRSVHSPSESAPLKSATFWPHNACFSASRGLLH